MGVSHKGSVSNAVWKGKNGELGTLTLRNSHIGNLMDAKDAWPARGQLHLDGFTFDHLGGFDRHPIRNAGAGNGLVGQLGETRSRLQPYSLRAPRRRNQAASVVFSAAIELVAQRISTSSKSRDPTDPAKVCGPHCRRRNGGHLLRNNQRPD
jgi:hypothetical protein